MERACTEVRQRFKPKKPPTKKRTSRENSQEKNSKPQKSYASISSLMLIVIMVCFTWVSLHSGELSRRLNTDTSKESKRASKDDSDENQLPRIDPVKVGNTRIGTYAGIRLTIKTLSVHPPIFEIPHFLSIQEISQIRDAAYRLGMEESQVVDEERERLYLEADEKMFLAFDKNNDSVVDADEVRKALIERSSLYFKEEDVRQMFKDTGADSNGNGMLDRTEFLNITTPAMISFLHKLSISQPRTLSRNSRQTWIDHYQMEGLAERVAAVTGIDVDSVKRSEPMQVVNYLPGGHYHCHFDSMDIAENEHLPCCAGSHTKPCRLCRYITLLYFLNSVKKGGETAFLMADNSTFNDKEWRKASYDMCDLSRSCHKANLVVKPERGKAVLWYNHFRNGYQVGRLDKRSLHGGCDVLSGEKWIANSWISIL